MAQTEEREKEREEANKLSAEGMAELREEKNKQELDEYIAEKRKEDQKNYSKWLDELRNKHKLTKRREGGPETHWDEVMELADAMINSEQNAYNDWRSNMMSLMNLFTKLNEAANISADQVAGEAWDMLKNPREDSWDLTKLISKGVIHAAEDKYTELKAKILHGIKGDGELDLPALQHKVTFKDGKVDIARLTRPDGFPLEADKYGLELMSSLPDPSLAKPNKIYLSEDPREYMVNGVKGPIPPEIDLTNLEAKLRNPSFNNEILEMTSKAGHTQDNKANTAFKTFVALWMAENDYVPGDREGVFVHHATGAVLDEDTFKRLNAKGAPTSLATFLKNNADLQYGEQQERRAGMSPST